MIRLPHQFSKYLVRFILWFLVCSGLFYLCIGGYANAILAISEWLLDFKVHGAGLSLSQAYSIIFELPSKPPVKADLEYNFFTLAFNIVFAPALVFTTLGVSIKSIRRFLVAAGIIAISHILHTLGIVYYLLIQLPDNSLIKYEFSPTFIKAISILAELDYTLVSYVLFPFMAWFIACYDHIHRLLDNAEASIYSTDAKRS